VARTLRFLVGLMGATCAAIGVYHFALGTATVAGESSADATVDSRERFYGAVFLGYGLAWLSAHRQRPISSATVRWLAGIFLLGGLGRLVSLAVRGAPQWSSPCSRPSNSYCPLSSSGWPTPRSGLPTLPPPQADPWSVAIRETCDFDRESMPRVLTSLSIRRVETPAG